MTEHILTGQKDAETASYIADMVAQLRKIVPGARYRDLRYLLGMAQLEAEELARRSCPVSTEATLPG